MASLIIFSSKSDEDFWFIQFNEMLSETNLETLNNIPVCIYQVPKSLSCAKPEAFTPQIIAIGPYNHFRPEFYPMERFKIFSAKRVIQHFNTHDINQLVKKLSNTVSFVRACYHKYLHINDDTLLYTMVIDGLFLLYFFHNYLDEKESCSFLTGVGQQLEKSGVKHTKDDIIKDVFMVENQIPTFIMRRILVIESSEDKLIVEEKLGSMLLSFCTKHCPLKITQTWTKALANRYHLLDLMYHLVVPENEKSETTATSEREGMCNTSATDAPKSKKCSISEGIDKVKKKVYVPIKGTRDYLKKMKEMNLSLLSPIKPCIDGIVSMLNVCQNSTSETSPFDIEAPKVVLIPSVRELRSVGINCKPSEGGISTIHFDESVYIFYLPVIELDANSEVIMRNLVAYEALTQPNSLIFTRYTELMGAMIDTLEDVKLLKDADIIEKTSSLSVDGTLELFNGMNKSIGPTKTVKLLDETIEKVNKCYRKKQKFSLCRSFTSYVYSSWQFFTLLATLVLLAMTALQTVCTVYDCPSHFRHK
ncbi:putative UPF0481 protein At3g02645 [Gastrolobium bilobum]|uniref:putative UPF0481 protein At3g02645 n=1 Tax=Gastrolobium bilobum TaxID=150636 RepID=UPI002AB1882E|nr:putative UPF0481 protein At3g02645 [Gastrolobium bilobum]